MALRGLDVLSERLLIADCRFFKLFLFPLKIRDVSFGRQMNAGEREYYRRKGRNDFRFS
jgi:hypothetical protein